MQEQSKQLRAALGLGERAQGAAPGSAPGTLVFREDAHPTRLHVIAYDGGGAFEERDVDTVADARALTDRYPNMWLDVVGLGTESVIRSLGDAFSLHRLVLEDVLNTHQRAKAETYPGALYCVVRMPMVGHPGTEQVSVLLVEGMVITIQERPGDVFEAVRDRLRDPERPIRQRGGDYLLYAIVDAVIDSYFPVLDALSERLELLEEEVMSDPTEATAKQIHAARRELVGLRRVAWPHRDMMNSLIRDSGGVVTDNTALYLRDVYDHAMRIIELTDSMRDLSSDLLSTYMSVVSNRMNEVMKVLTIIATIFIPLSFIAGVYGMNFDPDVSPWNMPELGWTYGYPAVLFLMLAFAVGLLGIFRRKGWL